MHLEVGSVRTMRGPRIWTAFSVSGLLLCYQESQKYILSFPGVTKQPRSLDSDTATALRRQARVCLARYGDIVIDASTP